LEIRHGRQTRIEAIEIIREQGDCLPLEDIEKFCRFVGIKLDEFFVIIEPFRNNKIWSHTGSGLEIKNFLVSDFDWKEFSRKQL
jgi:hypothetical protein